MKRRAAIVGVALAVAVVFAAGSQLVFAAFTSTKTVAQGAISSATLQPPTSVTATGGCQTLIIGPKMTLNWTITTSTFATGYNVYRSGTNGGPYTFLALVSGRATNTYVDTTVTGLNTTYYYVLRSVFSNWTSVNSNQATGTTPVLCL